MSKHPYAKESRSLVRTLKRHKLNPVGVRYDGEPTIECKNENALLDEMMACDDCRLIVEWETGRKASLWLIYGNGPGELVADWGIPEDTPEMSAAIDAAVDEHYARWDV